VGAFASELLTIFFILCNQSSNQSSPMRDHHVHQARTQAVGAETAFHLTLSLTPLFFLGTEQQGFFEG
jgi:hypothetical protein